MQKQIDSRFEEVLKAYLQASEKLSKLRDSSEAISGKLFDDYKIAVLKYCDACKDRYGSEPYGLRKSV